MATQAEYKASSQQSELDEVLEKINEIAKVSATGNYIYRGERAHHQEPPYKGLMLVLMELEKPTLSSAKTLLF